MARDLRLFYLFRLLSTSYVFVPIQVLYAFSRGLDWVEVMLLNTIYCLVVILTEVPTGALADRFGRRPAMMAGALAMVAACVTYYFADAFVHFVVAESFAALSMTLCSGADSAYLFDLLNDSGRAEEYARSEGTASAWHQGGNTVAFAVGGVLGATSLALPFLVTAGVASLAFFVAVFLREERVPPVKRAPLGAHDYLDHMRGSLRQVFTQGRLLWVVLYSAVVFVLLRATIYIYQPYLTGAGFSILETGLIFAVVYLVATAVAHRADALRRRFSEAALLFWLLGTLVVTFFLLGSAAGPWALGVLVVQAAANGLYSPLVKPLLNREIDDSRRRATVLSVESMVRRAAFGVFSPAVGALMESHGAASGLLACGLVGLFGLVALAARWPAGLARARAAGGVEPGAGPDPLRAPAAVGTASGTPLRASVETAVGAKVAAVGTASGTPLRASVETAVGAKVAPAVGGGAKKRQSAA